MNGMKLIMLNKITDNPIALKMIVYIILAAAIWGVYSQVTQFDFVNFDDPVYVIQNSHIQSGMTRDGLKWAFGTTYFGLWNPLVWLSFMLDYQLYGLNAGGYHLTNLVLHLLSALLLLWLLTRMTQAIGPSAFAAALFALHPMHTESVAWIAERKDVLSAFFWILTLCLYVWYIRKQVLGRYLAVLLCFACALMSKPMAVTLPVIMILMDYWPLKRFEPQQGKINLLLEQLKEKTPFFIVSALLIVFTLTIPNERDLRNLPLGLSFANASVSAITYLAKTLWPHNMAVFYPFPDKIPLWQVSGAVILLIFITTAVILMMKRRPYLFVGWFWYIITILPVIGIIHIADFAMADRYYYLPSIGIAVMLAWGIPLFFPNRATRKKILFPAAIAFLAVMSVLTWRQCGYWRDSKELWTHTLQVTEDNALAYNNLGYTLFTEGKVKESIEYYNKSISITQGDASAYNKRGMAYASLGQHQRSISDFNEAIRLKPNYAPAFYNRGNIYKDLGQYKQAIKDFDDTIRLSPYYTKTYNRRAAIYLKLGNMKMVCLDAQKACELGDCRLLKFAKDKKYCQ
jgi:Tfp pilus assembly protein PilF